MSHKQNVKRLYSIINARWYNPFRWFWNNFSKKAEKEFVKKLKKTINPNSEILDIGCGTGINTKRIINTNKKFKKYVGVDLTKDMLDIAKKRYKEKNIFYKKKDITKGIDSKYDIIISTWVMSHLQEPSKIINDSYKHLKKNGIILFIFLTKPKWYVNFWFRPFIKLFSSNYVKEEELNKIKAKHKIQKYNASLTTFLTIKKSKGF